MRYLKFLVKLLISAAALYLVFTKIEFKSVFGVVRGIHWEWLIPAILFFILSQVISAFRLNNFLKSVGVYISERYNLKLYLLGMYYNLFLPGGIGGDGYKIYLLRKSFEVKLKKLIYALILDRVSGVAAIAGLGAVLVYFTPLPVWIYPWVWVLFPLAVAGFFLLIKLFFNYFLPVFAPVTLLSFAVQLAQVVSALIILKAIGIHQDFGGYLTLFLASSIAAAIPLTIGGAGARELTFLYGSALLGLEEAPSVALSLIFYLITVLVSFGGIYFSFRGLGVEK